MARAEFCIQPLEFARQSLLARLAGGPLLTARVAGVHKPGVAYASHPASDSDMIIRALQAQGPEHYWLRIR